MGKLVLVIARLRGWLETALAKGGRGWASEKIQERNMVMYIDQVSSILHIRNSTSCKFLEPDSDVHEQSFTAIFIS